MFRLLSIGVNGTGVDALNYAEKDAQDIFEAFTGGEGPVQPADARLLLGGSATLRRVNKEFSAVRKAAPEYLMLYFAGHGSPESLELSDGSLHFRDLHNAIMRIDALHTLIILDSCYAAGYNDYTNASPIRVAGVLSTPWLDLLARAAPGTRLMFAVDRNNTSQEDPTIRNGLFTHAIIKGLRNAKATISHNGQHFVSERGVFLYAKRFIRDVLKGTQVPESRRLKGDFPLFRPQSINSIGDGWILSAVTKNNALKVSFQIEDRQFVPTTLTYEFFLDDGSSLYHGSRDVRPESTSDQWSFTININRKWFYSHAQSWRTLQNRSPRTVIFFCCRIRLVDTGGTTLDEETVDSEFYPNS